MRLSSRGVLNKSIVQVLQNNNDGQHVDNSIFVARKPKKWLKPYNKRVRKKKKQKLELLLHGSQARPRPKKRLRELAALPRELEVQRQQWRVHHLLLKISKNNFNKLFWLKKRPKSVG